MLAQLSPPYNASVFRVFHAEGLMRI